LRKNDQKRGGSAEKKPRGKKLGSTYRADSNRCKTKSETIHLFENFVCLGPWFEGEGEVWGEGEGQRKETNARDSHLEKKSPPEPTQNDNSVRQKGGVGEL